MMYKVFVRNWWRDDKNWPGGLAPDPNARKYTLHRGLQKEEDARRLCLLWNTTHQKGRLSRKAEYTEV